MTRWTALFAALACFFALRRHKPVRQFVGGYRCSECGKPGDSFDSFGSPGYVNPIHKTYSRGRAGGVTRSSDWGEM